MPENENQPPQIYYQYWQGTRSGKWFWHARGMNHEVICQGETNGYHNKADCLKAIELLKNGAAAEVKERGK
jgi:uncharacterized protein YegP (UPF0339 family)